MFISDSKDQRENLYTFGHSFGVNENQSRMSINVSGLGRREARYLRIRLLYAEQNSYALP